MVLDDFNGDGLPDIAMPNFYDYSASVLLNQTSFLTLELQDDAGNVLANGVEGTENLDLVTASYIAYRMAPITLGSAARDSGTTPWSSHAGRM